MVDGGGGGGEVGQVVGVGDGHLGGQGREGEVVQARLRLVLSTRLDGVSRVGDVH